MAEVKLKIYGALCATEIFIINGVQADCNDFGTQFDEEPESAEPYSCRNMTFKPGNASSEVLAKYKITKEEFLDIARQLAKGLSFGNCGLCS